MNDQPQINALDQAQAANQLASFQRGSSFDLFKMTNPPPEKPVHDKKKRLYLYIALFVMYITAVTFSAVHTIPVLIEPIPSDAKFIGLSLRWLAGAPALIAYELGSLIIPVIINLFLMEGDKVKDKRKFMRRSMWSVLTMIILVLFGLNIISTLEGEKAFTTEQPEPPSNSIAANYRLISSEPLPVKTETFSDMSKGEKAVFLLEKILWVLVAISPVMIGYVSGEALSIAHVTDNQKHEAAMKAYDQRMEKYKLDFEEWDRDQQRRKQGVYSTKKAVTQLAAQQNDNPDNPEFVEVVETSVRKNQDVDSKGRNHLKYIRLESGQYVCPNCEREMSKQGWASHPCRYEELNAAEAAEINRLAREKHGQ